MKSPVLSLFLAFLICRGVSAAGPEFESGPNKVQLLELFTSEGCSSCPPAEAAFARLLNDPRLWHEFVPIAFHVDYWDNLGWKDPFASADWTRRQRAYASLWKSDSVYTPAFVLDGREWRAANVPAASGQSPGNLKVSCPSGDTFVVSFEPAQPGNFDLYLARLGFAITSNVRAGENIGHSLRHEFVVLSLAHDKLSSVPQEIHLLPARSAATFPKTAVAAWVTRAGEISPIQATGGWLPSQAARSN